MKLKSAFFAFFAVLLSSCFSKENVSCNLLNPDWKERPEYMQILSGDWENGENTVSFTGSRICSYCIDNGDWYVVEGLFTADEHNLYVANQDTRYYFDVLQNSSELVIPYTLSENGNAFSLALTVAGKIFTFKKISNSMLPKRRQNTLNGEWNAEKTWKEATDWNITLKFEEESFLVKICGSHFSYSLLGDVFYERGMMCITKIKDSETEYYSEKVKFPSNDYDYAMDYIVDYTAKYALPEYIFFAARSDSPYHAICNYKLDKDTLTIMAYGKEIKLYRHGSE